MFKNNKKKKNFFQKVTTETLLYISFKYLFYKIEK